MSAEGIDERNILWTSKIYNLLKESRKYRSMSANTPVPVIYTFADRYFGPPLRFMHATCTLCTVYTRHAHACLNLHLCKIYTPQNQLNRWELLTRMLYTTHTLHARHTNALTKSVPAPKEANQLT